MTRGFLRSRGDAPSRTHAEPRGPLVPPLTRRCARASRDLGVFFDGSSAHAEMRRRRGDGGVAAGGFLRSRGDAPALTTRVEVGRRVPPLTRRCAPSRDRGSAGARGSSAHAEMRPSARQTSRWGPWFLRSRGDAPEYTVIEVGQSLVPPLTRRCAAPRRALRAPTRGSSAHAEMRPSPTRTSSAGTGFLRSRGDAPAGTSPPASST